MSRLLRITIWFLLLGAAANVAVTLILAAWDEEKLADPQLIARLRRAEWKNQEQGKGGNAIWIQIAYSDWCGDIVITTDSDNPSTPATWNHTTSHRIGWRFRALFGTELIHKRTNQSKASEPAFRGAIKLAKPLRIGYLNAGLNAGPAPVATSNCNRLLPFMPVWPGFIGNTVADALALWLLWVIPLTIRNAIRRLRGRCGACGYPVGLSPVCTECGRPVRQRRDKPQLAASGDAKL